MSGITVLDAGVLISYLDDRDAHHADSMRAMRRLIDAGDRFVSSAVTVSEALVRPARDSEGALAAAYEDLTAGALIEIVAIDDAMCLEIARARATKPSLKTPDAVVLATARSMDADRILTTDHRLAKFDEAVTVRGFEG